MDSDESSESSTSESSLDDADTTGRAPVHMGLNMSDVSVTQFMQSIC